MSPLRRFVLVVIGGMAGSLVWYLVVAEGGRVPVGLVVINALGALLAG